MSQPQYYKANPDAARTQQRVIDQNSERRYSNRETEFENGITVFRLLPPWSQSGAVSKLKSMWFKNKLNWNCIQDGALPVLSEMWPDQQIDDPIMNALIRINQFSDMSEMFPGSPRFLINALILSNLPEGGTQPISKPDWFVPKVVRVSKKGNDWLRTRISDPHLADVSDPYQGYWLGCTKTGTGWDTRYDWTYYADYPRALTEDANVMQQIVQGITDLDQFIGTPDNDMVLKQQAVADELLRRYNIHGTMVQGVSAPGVGSPAAPTMGGPAAPTIGTPQGPVPTTPGASAPMAPGGPQPPTPAAPPAMAPPAAAGAPPAPAAPVAAPPAMAPVAAPPAAPVAAPPAAAPVAAPPAMAPPAPVSPPAALPAAAAPVAPPVPPTAPPAAAPPAAVPPAAPVAPTAPPAAVPPAAPVANAPPGGAPPVPFPVSAVGAPPVAQPPVNAGVPVPPSAPTSGPVPTPASAQPVPGQDQKETPPCFAGLSETNVYLNEPKCRTCWKEMECSQIDLKRSQGGSVGTPLETQGAMAPPPSAIPTTMLPPTAATAPVSASPPVPAAAPAPSTASTPAATVAPSPSEGAPVPEGIPPCMGNRPRNLPPAEGFTCEPCAYVVPCESMQV